MKNKAEAFQLLADFYASLADAYGSEEPSFDAEATFLEYIEHLEDEAEEKVGAAAVPSDEVQALASYFLHKIA